MSCSVCSLCAPCVLCVCSVCALCVLCVCSVYALCVLCVCSVCAHCVLCVCSLCALCVLCVCSLCAHRVLSVSTYCPPHSWSVSLASVAYPCCVDLSTSILVPRPCLLSVSPSLSTNACTCFGSQSLFSFFTLLLSGARAYEENPHPPCSSPPHHSLILSLAHPYPSLILILLILIAPLCSCLSQCCARSTC